MSTVDSSSCEWERLSGRKEGMQHCLATKRGRRVEAMNSSSLLSHDDADEQHEDSDEDKDEEDVEVDNGATPADVPFDRAASVQDSMTVSESGSDSSTVALSAAVEKTLLLLGGVSRRVLDATMTGVVGRSVEGLATRCDGCGRGIV